MNIVAMRSSTQSPTVLLVEDIPDLRQLIENYLGLQGYKVMAAGDGPTALTILQDEPRIDIMISDVMLPGPLDGLSLARIVQERMPSAAIILMTGYANTLDHNPNFNHVRAYLLTKPFRLSNLIRCLEQAIAAPITSGGHST